ncbi:3-dehydroquinate synthase [Cytophagaceae bacterium ABcell3]|nr:3-dehydroquinate synthase [Cytophagaceae bacterium ABcell3]
MPSEIFITSNIAGKIRQYLEGKQYSGICIIVDENTEEHCLPLLLPSLPGANIIAIKSGEENKNLATCEHIWQKMTDLQLDRKALVINVGGGVIGDMGGFCAATYKRGIDFIQVPTTLLSQVDASVGGKLGVDFQHFKNHIGVFCEPVAVFIDTVFLKTLPVNELRSGYAEVIKHCLIADSEKWEEISLKSFEEQNWNDLVKHSIQMKAKITSEDPFEGGLRKILNFGHTIGHAIESYFLNIPGKKLLHGEAIAIGMIAEAFIAHDKGFISENDLNKIKSYILSVFGHRELFEYDLEKIITLTLQDKKNERNAILCSLLEEPGKANYNQPVQFREIRDALKFYSL